MPIYFADDSKEKAMLRIFQMMSSIAYEIYFNKLIFSYKLEPHLLYFLKMHWYILLLLLLLLLLTIILLLPTIIIQDFLLES